MENTILPATDNKFKGFKQAAPIGNGIITDNGNGSFTFSSKDTNSNCIMYWQKPAIFGETIKFYVKACVAEGENIAVADNCPRFSIQWKDQNGNYKRTVDGFITTTDINQYELTYTVNQPVSSGDIIVCSFGHFRSSLITGTFCEAQVFIKNSSLSVRREIIGGILNINASVAGILPKLEYNLNYTLLKPDNIIWLNNTIAQIIDSRLKGIDGTQMSPLWNFDVALNDPASSDFYKYRLYAGFLNRSSGTINFRIYDTVTNDWVDFSKNKTTLIPVVFNVYYI